MQGSVVVASCRVRVNGQGEHDPGGGMTTETRVRHVVNDGGLDEWLDERRRLGQDGRDEVWGGVYHVVPHARSNHGKLAHKLSAELNEVARARGVNPTGEFNLGDANDYRIPDMGWTASPVDDADLYVPSVEIVVELESPGDETWQKVPFYFARGVREVWVIAPHDRGVRVLTSVGHDVGLSDVLGVTLAQIRAALGWD